MAEPRAVVRIDRSLCRGAGICARIAPTLFEVDAERRARVVGDLAQGGDAALARAREAEQRCPYFAIEVVTEA